MEGPLYIVQHSSLFWGTNSERANLLKRWMEEWKLILYHEKRQNLPAEQLCCKNQFYRRFRLFQARQSLRPNCCRLQGRGFVMHPTRVLSLTKSITIRSGWFCGGTSRQQKDRYMVILFICHTQSEQNGHRSDITTTELFEKDGCVYPVEIIRRRANARKWEDFYKRIE